MRHLIVEACIARNLLDTSAYFWQGYVNGCINQMPQSLPPQAPGWTAFMKGAPLNHIMINALTSTPASRYTRLNEPTVVSCDFFLFCLDIGNRNFILKGMPLVFLFNVCAGFLVVKKVPTKIK